VLASSAVARTVFNFMGDLRNIQSRESAESARRACGT
jgi:hypothetical protein